MPHLLFTHGGRTRSIPLAAATLVGRESGCLAWVEDPAVPLHWLELRWGETGWAWRPLGAEERTRGTGKSLGNGWRALSVSEGRGTRITIGSVAVELVSDGPPVPFLWDLIAQQAIEGEAMDAFVEVRGDVLIPLAAEGDPTFALRDGATWLHEGVGGRRVLRAHVPHVPPPTREATVDLRVGGVVAEVNPDSHSLLLLQGRRSVEVTGACVLSLAVYAGLGPGEAGWLTTVDAWCRWVGLGGLPDAGVDAVTSHRGRLRRVLDKAGVAGLTGMVERRRVGTGFQTRVGPGFDRVVVVR